MQASGSVLCNFVLHAVVAAHLQIDATMFKADLHGCAGAQLWDLTNAVAHIAGMWPGNNTFYLQPCCRLLRPGSRLALGLAAPDQSEDPCRAVNYSDLLLHPQCL